MDSSSSDGEGEFQRYFMDVTSDVSSDAYPFHQLVSTPVVAQGESGITTGTTGQAPETSTGETSTGGQVGHSTEGSDKTEEACVKAGSKQRIKKGGKAKCKSSGKREKTGAGTKNKESNKTGATAKTKKRGKAADQVGEEITKEKAGKKNGSDKAKRTGKTKGSKKTSESNSTTEKDTTKKSGKTKDKTGGKSKEKTRKGKFTMGGVTGRNVPTHVAARREERQNELRTLIMGLDIERLRELLLGVVERESGLLLDLLNCPPRDNIPTEREPGWCVCGNCRPMPLDIEALCCGMRPQNCLSRSEYVRAMLDPFFIGLQQRLWANLENRLGREQAPGADHKRKRHQTYRSFVLWQHGRLGLGNRVVVPSCVVCKTRDEYPDPNGFYTGFRHADL